MKPAATQSEPPPSLSDRSSIQVDAADLRSACGVFSSTDYTDEALEDLFSAGVDWLERHLAVWLVNRSVVDYWPGWARLELSAQGPVGSPVSLETYGSLAVAYRDPDLVPVDLEGGQWTLDVSGAAPAVVVSLDPLPMISRTVANPVSAAYLYRAPAPPPGIREAALMTFREIFNSVHSDVPWQTPALQHRVDAMCQGYGRNWGVA